MAYTIHTKDTFTETKRRVNNELLTWQRDSGKRITFSFEINVPISRQFSRNLMPSERAASLSIDFSDGRKIVWGSDSQETPADNARLLCIALERLRLLDKAGLTDMMRTALMQLAAPMEAYAVLGVKPTASKDEIQKAYLRLAQERHPDKEGGSDEAMAELNTARDEALKALDA